MRTMNIGGRTYCAAVAPVHKGDEGPFTCDGTPGHSGDHHTTEDGPFYRQRFRANTATPTA